MYKCIIWDMDGTLVNTYRGIYNAYDCAFEKMGMAFEGDAFVKKVIGAPLKNVFTDTLQMPEEKAVEAVGFYRGYYAEKGVLEVDEYPGLKDVLKKLKESGYVLCVGTLKKEAFAKMIVEQLGIADLFAIVKGVDDKDQLTKKDIVKLCMEHVGCSEEESILIGDSEFDEDGAELAGIDFGAVLYGFGFKNRAPERKKAVFETPADIEAFFTK